MKTDLLLTFGVAAGLWVGFAGTAIAQPANDDFDERILLEGRSESVTFDLAESTTEPGEPILENNDIIGSSWYEFVASIDGILQIDSNGSEGSFYLGIYFSESEELFNLKSVYIGGSTDRHLVQFPVTEGARFYVQAFDAHADFIGELSGPLVLNFAVLQNDEIDSSNFTTVSTLDNDDFTDRIVLEGRLASAIGYFRHASVQSQEMRADTSVERTIWYEWESPMGGWFSIGLTNYRLSNWNSVGLSLWDGDALENLSMLAATSRNDDPVESITGSIRPGSNLKIALSDAGRKIAGLLDISVSFPFGEESVGVGGNWNFSPWYGFYNDENFPWIFHDQHGWQFLSRAQGGANASWIYDLSLGWLWVSEEAYPSVYSVSERSWLYYDESTESPRWFYHFDNNEWVSFD